MLMAYIRVQSLYAVALGETLLNRSGELRDLICPSLGIMLLEARQKGLEHAIELRRRVIPLHDSITEPKKTLKSGDSGQVNLYQSDEKDENPPL